MNRRFTRNKTFAAIAAAVAILASTAAGIAQTPQTVPDAQVEANVLRALAAAPDLASLPITTTTVYGVVTLSGTVQSEALRTEVENVASRTSGVKKVVDEITLPGETANSSAAPSAQNSQGGVMSDGTIAPPDGAQPQNQPDPNSASSAPNANPSYPNYGPGAPEYPQGSAAQQNSYPPQQGYPQQPRYPRQPSGYPQQQPYAPAYGGQEAGQQVTVPVGAMVRIRINQALDSGRTKPGTHFDGIVVNDVAGDGAIAIPRGAAIHGTVVDAKAAGSLAGRGELSLQLTSVTLAGRTYPIVSNIWDHHAGDKTTETVNRTAVGGVIGALIGAAAGGGKGAAIGAGIGGAAGLGSSAASGDGQMVVPSEGMLTFQLAQPATLDTVSQQEMDRLAQGVPMPAPAPQPLRRRVYPYPYGPGYPYPY